MDFASPRPQIRLKPRFQACFFAAACLALLLCPSIPSAFAQTTIHVAAASDLQPVMPVWTAGFEKATGIKVAVSYGSSSMLATQIINGAPMDIFFSADYVFAEQIVAANLADTSEPKAYAKGTLVLWARKDSHFQPLSLNALSDPKLKSLAVANPDHAPYGRAAVAALQGMKVYANAAPHIVQAENIAQAAQFVESGNAELAILSLTIASSQHFQDIGSYVYIPTYAYPEIRQTAVVIRKSAEREAAHKFLDYVLSGPVQAEMPKFGLQPVFK